MERYKDLPEDIQQALFSSTTSDAILVIGKKNGLAIDKIGELVDETGLMMLGITSPSDYVKNLVSRLSVPQEKARAIAEEINQKVFQPVRESLKKIHVVGEQPPTPPTTPKPPPSPPYEGGDKGEVIPPIFVKKIPLPSEALAKEGRTDILPAKKEPMPQNSLAAKTELEKALGAENLKPQTQPYKGPDPYREIIE